MELGLCIYFLLLTVKSIHAAAKGSVENQKSEESLFFSSSPSTKTRLEHYGVVGALHDSMPYFQDHRSPVNVTAQLGSTTYLDCKIKRLRDKTVSWVRREGEEIKLLTFGLHTYSNDERYSLSFEHPNNWKLQIKYTQKRDEGTYECQISTHPPKVFIVYLNIVAPIVEILDEKNEDVKEKFYKAGATIELRCTISQMPQAQTFILWRHGDHMLNYDTTRGGISVKTDMSSSVIVSTLFIANAAPFDVGNYTCSLGDVASGSVYIHVLNGGDGVTKSNWQKEDQPPAAMELGCGNIGLCCFELVFAPAIASLVLQLLQLR